MELKFKEDEESVIFQVSDFAPEYEKVLQDSFYTGRGDSYIKEYPKEEIELDNLAAIERNFLEQGEEMFAQMAYLKPVLWQEALFKFIERVEGKNIDWWLTGSCAAAVRGIALEPHDVDIMLSGADLAKVKNIFQEDMIEPLCHSQNWIVKHFAVLFLESRIDLAFDPLPCLDDPKPSDCGPYAARHLEEVTWRGKLLKVPPLQLQYQVNKKRGRLARAELIQVHLDKR